jgi:hypothetical protein
MGYYPLMMDLTGRKCLVVGGGEVARDVERQRAARLQRALGHLVAVHARLLVVRVERGRVEHAVDLLDPHRHPGAAELEDVVLVLDQRRAAQPEDARADARRDLRARLAGLRRELAALDVDLLA